MGDGKTPAEKIKRGKPTYEELEALVDLLSREAEELRELAAGGRSAGRALSRISKQIEARSARGDGFSRVAQLAMGGAADIGALCGEMAELVRLESEKPGMTCVEIELRGKKCQSKNFKATALMEPAEIYCIGEPAGEVRIYSLEAVADGVYSHSFIGADRALIETAAGLLGRLLERRDVEEKLRALGVDAMDRVFAGRRGICLLDDAVIKGVNSRFAEMLRMPPAALAGTAFAGLVAQSDLPRMAGRYARHKTGDEPVQIYETTLVGRDGERVFVEIDLAPFEAGGARYDLMMVTDVAGLDIAGEASRLAAEEFNKSEMELESLLECSGAVLNFPEFKDAAASILGTCIRHTRSAAGYVVLYDEDGNENVLSSTGGIFSPRDKDLPGWVMEASESSCKSGRAVYVNDIKGAEFERIGHGSMMVCCISIKARVVGAIALAGKAGGYTARDAKTVTAFSDLAALAFHNALSLENLKNSEVFFRSVTETASDAIISTDAAGVITFWNAAAEKIFGYTAEEILGSPYFSLLTPDKKEMHEKLHKDGAKPRNRRVFDTPFEGSARRKDGTDFPVELTLTKWTSGGQDAFTVIVRDITRRLANRSAREAAEMKYSLMADTASDSIFVVGKDYKIEYLNKFAAGTIGKNPGEVIGCSIEEIFPPATLAIIKPELEQVITTGEPLTQKEDPIEFPGGMAWLSTNLMPIKDGAGKTTSVLGISRDITRRKSVEAELVKATEGLERRVAERTAELEAINEKLRVEFELHEAAEAALRESEERYYKLFNTMPDAILIADVESHRYRFANPAACNMLGYKLEEILEKKVGEFTAPEYADEMPERFDKICADGKKIAGELLMQRKHGTLVYTEMNYVPAVIDGRKMAIGFFRDVTERWVSQRALRESEERYRTLAEAARDFIFIVDADGFLHYVNSFGAAQFGKSPKDIIGMRLGEIFPPEIADRQLGNVRNVIHTGEPLYVENPAKFGDRETWLSANLVPIRNQLDEVTTVLGISRDITERKMAEQTLRESEERFRRIADNSPDMILRWTINRGVEYISRAVEAITGFTPEDVVDNMGFFASRIHPEDLPAFITELNSAAAGPVNRITQIEYRLMHNDGHYVWLESRVMPVKALEGGKIQFVEAITRDISDRKRAEVEKTAMQQQLIQSQKMEAMGTLAGGMAHDFNNILSIIIGTSEIGLRKCGEEEPCHDRFKKILKASDRARELTLKLLTFAKREKLNIKTVPIVSIIDDVVDMIRRALTVKVSITTELANCSCNISADVNQIYQALLNICINAVEAMQDGGQLTITACKEAAADPQSGGAAEFCNIKISDTGIGMTPDVMEKIFDPFFTTRGTGTGLGLAVTMGIITNHGGGIDVESEPGRGTVFTVRLPVSRREVTPGSEGDPLRALHRGSGTVFVIDDNRDFMDVVSEALTMVGYTVLTAASGHEALCVYAKYLGKIDVVLLDMIMAEMDGSELFHSIRLLDPDARIVICSGHSKDGKASELLQSGALGFIQKPCTIAELFEKIVLVLTA